MPPVFRDDPYPAYNFEVMVTGISDDGGSAKGSFKEVSGLEAEVEVIEYRTGFPYVVTDAAQRYADVPNRNRYPDFVSVDARVSKDIKVNAKYSVRLALSVFNLMNHFNPEAVHYNTGDPAFGMCFGHRGRRFTGDFDVLF